jgi:D-3-phosphoglycerate dehydrogenase
MRILVVGDSYMTADAFADVFADRLAATHSLRYLALDEQLQAGTPTTSEQLLSEYVGSPEQLIAELGDDDEVLVVHGAPVTAEVLDAAHALRLVCCARGGPVNIDVSAATDRGIPVATTPGKNADAVAELTIAFLIMLARRVDRAQADLATSGALRTAFDGARNFGTNVAGKTLGLVGFGRVGRRITPIARALGMTVLAFDPFVDDDDISERGAVPSDLLDLLAESDFVSLHARATSDNENLFGEEEFASMKEGAFFINTARESLIDEHALARALATGQVRAAAVDVLRSDHLGNSARNPLVDLENVIATPHIGGATDSTLARGAHMLADEIERFASGAPLQWSINGLPAHAAR